MEIRDAVAIVTGGSSGIGLAAGRALAGAGARVALVARTRGPLDEAARSIGAEGFACDVADRAAVRAMVEAVEERLGPPRILVNNAAFNARGAVTSRTAEELAQVIETNLVAPVFLTRLVLERMPAPAAIVNVASLAGIVPLVGEAAYSASKAGLRAFGAALREELAERGISVSTVCPGPVSTPFLLDNIDEVPDLVFSQPMTSAEEVATAILDCVRNGQREVALPALSGVMSQVGYLFPALRARLTPMLERIGARNKGRYRAGN
jgi:short-subunit dehydrogenase